MMIDDENAFEAKMIANFNARVNAESSAGIGEKKPKKKPTAKKNSEEIGGPKGLEPTRYGDWEAKGRCSDF
ncbi:MAG: DUF1674 domain-containing protein [Arenicella sp.]